MSKIESRSYTNTLKQVRVKKAAAGGAGNPYRIAIGGNCNARFLEPGLRLAMMQEGLTPILHECDHDSWIGACLNPEFKTDAWIIWLSAMGVSGGGIERRQLDLAAINQAISVTLERGERVVVILPETIDIALDGFSPFAVWNSDLRDAVKKALPDGTFAINPDLVALADNVPNWFAPAYWSLAKLPLHPDAATVLARNAGEVILRSRLPLVKAVIVDLDNTLWGGVIGEDGVENIRLDPGGDGQPYLQMQRLLKDFSDQGIPLAVVSKNNPEDAPIPFKKIDSMILTENDFVAFHAGWDSKYLSIQAIVDELSIGIDTVCFIDDSPHERDEARAFLPRLIVPELPEKPELRPSALLDTGLFTKPATSKEDLARIGFYKDEAKRREHSETYQDWVGYLTSLEMQVGALPVSSSNLQRVTSLVHKTNQFNLTNRRHDSAQIKVIAEDPDWFAYCYTLNDRFGSSGIIGTMLAHANREDVEIDTWLISCRVINRQVELAMFDHLIQWMSGRGATRLAACYKPTAQNKLVENLLADLQLEHMTSDDAGEHYMVNNPVAPDHCASLNVTTADSQQNNDRM